ncbi:MAG TPA: hypothetical protein VI431_06345 [Candidatus Acidoferrum sp.]
MSAEHYKRSRQSDEPPHHSDVSFEERDIKAGTIYWYLFSLGMATAVALVTCIFVLHLTNKLAVSSDVAPPPSRAALGEKQIFPPEPRLQGVPGHESDPQKDLRKKLKADTEANEKLEWIDRNAGIAQIPVEDAMKIVAEKGLPSFSQAPAGKEERKK